MYLLDVHTRREIIFRKFEEKFGVSPGHVETLQRSQMFGEIFNEILPSFIRYKEDRSIELETLFNVFILKVSPEIKEIKNDDMAKQKNIYQMFGAASLSSSNAITRKLNTKLGLFWEVAANLSNNVVSLEKEFGVKLPGVDVVVLHDEKLFYTQLKSQKNTLTGSQSGRVDVELGSYENSWFVACVNNKAGWTYSGSIPKLVGEQFWNKTSLDYEDIINNLERTIHHIEELVTI